MSPFAWQREREATAPSPIRRGHPLAVRISAPLALLVVVVFAAHLYFNDPQKLVTAQKRGEAARLGAITQAIIHREMLAGLPGNVQEHLEPLRESGAVERILVIDPAGIVRFANDPAEIGRALPRLLQPECLICEVVPGDIVEPVLSRREVDGREIFSYSFLLASEDDCQVCHRSGQPYLGQVLLDLELTDADRELLTAGHGVAASAGVLLVLAIAGIFLITRILVQRPIRNLLEATHQIEIGNFSPPFPPPRGDEFGLLSVAFQRMSKRLGDLISGQEREIRRRTADLENSHSALLRQEKLAALGRMTAGVAHEIGNPMGAISALSEVIERATDEPAVLRECAEIREQVDRVSRLVRDLTDSARPFTRGSVANVGECLRSAQRVVTLDRREAKLTSFDIDEELEQLYVALPREHLIQVFVNLFSNSVEASTSGADVGAKSAGTIRVQIAEQEPELVLRISDEGPGVDPAHAAHLFEPFFTTKGATGGTGLGLWVCYTVLERWNGEIELCSDPASGAAFLVRLPRATAGGEDDVDPTSDRR